MASDQQKGDIQATVLGALPGILQTLTHDDAQVIIGAKGELLKGIRGVFEPYIRTKNDLYWLDEWTRFYAEVFGLECDYSQLRVPVSQEGFGWLLIADERITTQMAFDKSVERFPSWKYTDSSLDEAIPVEKDVRSHKNGTYAIRLRDRIEADKELKNRSANNLAQTNVSAITARERIILELWYHWKNNDHLDKENVTLDAGSRHSGGRVPRCRWDGGRFRVSWCDPVYAFDDIRARQVVS
jgi:hypothetical protein